MVIRTCALTFVKLCAWLICISYWLIHRADYQRILFDAAKENGVTIRLGSPIETVDEAGPIVILKNGEKLKADIVVGADGIRSRTRKSILKDQDVEAVDSPNCAYRATVPADIMHSDPAIAHLMVDINANCWIGHKRHVMAYPIRNGELYNMVLSHPGKASVGKWNEPGDLEEMKTHYSNFDPTIKQVLEHVTGCLKWKLAALPPLPKWVSDSGRVVLLGDAAHAMVPYLAQGAATSIEDGAALAECLDRAKDINDVPTLLRAFQAIRKPRCETIQKGSLANGEIWHMPDGPEQEQRDRDMKEIGKKSKNPNQWSDESFQPWLFGYDTVKEVRNKQEKPYYEILSGS
jgi:salicylate hydroxylase